MIFGRNIQMSLEQSLHVSVFMQVCFLPARRYASAGLCDSNVSICPSVCLSVTRRYCVKTKIAIEDSQRRDFFTIWQPQAFESTLNSSIVSYRLQFSDAKFHHQIVMGSPERGPQTRVGCENSAIFWLQASISRKRQQIRPKLLLVTNRKSYMGFRWTPRSMTQDDLELM